MALPLRPPLIPIHRRVVAYVASPYSHPDAAVRAARYRAAQDAVRAAVQAGVSAYVPIAMTGGLGDIDVSHEAWMEYDLPLLLRCDHVVVLTIEGWRESRGVQTEIEYAEREAKRIWYATPEQLPAVMRAISWTEVGRGRA